MIKIQSKNLEITDPNRSVAPRRNAATLARKELRQFRGPAKLKKKVSPKAVHKLILGRTCPVRIPWTGLVGPHEKSRDSTWITKFQSWACLEHT